MSRFKVVCSVQSWQKLTQLSFLIAEAPTECEFAQVSMRPHERFLIFAMLFDKWMRAIRIFANAVMSLVLYVDIFYCKHYDIQVGATAPSLLNGWSCVDTLQQCHWIDCHRRLHTWHVRVCRYACVHTAHRPAGDLSLTKGCKRP